MKWWFRKKLHTQIFICVAFGILIGFILGPRSTVIKPIGDIFIRLLKMLIVPLTFFTLANGITKMGDLRSLRSVGGMTLIFYLITSFAKVHADEMNITDKVCIFRSRPPFHDGAGGFVQMRKCVLMK